MTRTITLIGDSILDNAYYTGGQPCVADQVRQALPTWTVDMRAVDGCTARNVMTDQLATPPREGVIVLSAGGNDALASIEALLSDRGSPSITAMWSGAYDIRATFRRDYAELLDRACSFGQPVAVCTVYNPSYDREPTGEAFQRIAESGLALFNDVIVHEAMRRSLHIIDLRDICTRTEDFANPIEPSSIGGSKIAAGIRRWARGH